MIRIQSRIGLVASAILPFVATVANAAGLSGPIEAIDLRAATIVVSGESFVLFPRRTVGPNIDELMQGDWVKVTFSPNTISDGMFIALRIDMVEY